jgi:hypothetical protein
MNDIVFDKTYIKSKIEEVLKIAHTDSRKWRVKEHPDRLQYSCPVCGDSMTAPGRKLRGTLYWKNLMHICFNETGCNCSFLTLLKKFNIEIDLHQKINIYNYVDSNITYKKDDDFIIQHFDKLIDNDVLTEFLNTHPETQFSDFGPVKKNSAVFQYLKYDRLINNFENIYQADYHITPKWTEKVLVILNKSGKKILGLQIRNLKSEHDKRMFKIFNFEKLYNMLHPDEPLDELEAIGYNKYSNFYNILNVDWDRPVTVFEGYLDSIFYPNSIGAIGINSIDEMNFLTDENSQMQFFFDQDSTGVRKSITMLERGHKVFLWQKLNKKLIANKTDKYTAEQYCLKIKDLNKLAQEMKNDDPYTKLGLSKYFSDSPFDKLYLNFSLYPNTQKKKFTQKKKIL